MYTLFPYDSPIHVFFAIAVLVLLSICLYHLRAIRKELRRTSGVPELKAVDTPEARDLRAKGFNDDQIELILKK